MSKTDMGIPLWTVYAGSSLSRPSATDLTRSGPIARASSEWKVRRGGPAPVDRVAVLTGYYWRKRSRGSGGRSLLRAVMQQLGMTARSYHRMLKLARTIADLGGAPSIATHHLVKPSFARPPPVPIAKAAAVPESGVRLRKPKGLHYVNGPHRPARGLASVA